MKRYLFQNGTVLAERDVFSPGFCLVTDGVISACGAGRYPGEVPEGPAEVDLKGAFLSPGFVEMHTHGAGGSDFMDATKEDFITACRTHMAHGVTTICPTSMTSPDDALFRFFDAFDAVKNLKDGMPHLHGVHLEGPYFAPAQAGAQSPELMKTPWPEHCLKVLARGEDSIVRWSAAPEVEGVLRLGDELQRRGILASIAHTDADYDTVLAAMRHGFSHMTHFYCGMSMLHRENSYRILGAVEAGYLEDGLHIEIIADGIHLPPPLLKLIFKCIPHERISLTTDAMRAAGMPEGPSVLGSRENDFRVIVEDGVAKLPDRSSFAGSVATTDRLIRVVTTQAGIPLQEAVRMLTEHPARQLGIFEKTGSIREGKAADLILFDNDIHILAVYVDGILTKGETHT